jgi:hypothetical protein
MDLYLTEADYAAYRAGNGVYSFIRARIAALADPAGTGGTDEVNSDAAAAAEAPQLLLRERRGQLTLYSNYLLRSPAAGAREFVNIRLSDSLLEQACAECAGTAFSTGSDPLPDIPFPDDAFEQYAGAVALRICARESALHSAPDAAFRAAETAENKIPGRNLAIRAIFLSGIINGPAAAGQSRKLEAAYGRLSKETLTLAVSKAAGQYTSLELAALRTAGAILTARQ